MPLRLGMLGLWHTHATGMIRQIAAHPQEFQLVAAYDADPDVVARRREEWRPLVGSLPLRESIDDVLAESLDGVLVEGRVSENVALARRAVESGRGVLLEKPAGVNLADFMALVEEARRRRTHVQLAYLFRYMSAVQEMLVRARRGDFGQLYAFRGRLPKPREEYDRNVHELGGYRGGIFFEMAGHLIDFAVALLGTPQRVTSMLAHHHDTPGDFVDNGVAMIQFEHALAVLEVPALEVANDARRIELYGSDGALVIPHLGSGHLANGAVQPFEIYASHERRWQRHEPIAATLQIADLREFAAVVQGRKAPDFSNEHDLVVHRALLEACQMLDLR